MELSTELHSLIAERDQIHKEVERLEIRLAQLKLLRDDLDVVIKDAGVDRVGK